MLSLGHKLSLTTQPIYKFVNKYSIDFDGSDQYINVNTLAGTMSTGQAFTISVWFKSNSTATGAGENILFSAHDSGGSNVYRLGVSPTNSGGIFYGADTIVSNTTVGSTVYNDNKWHHLVVTKSTGASLTTFYVDGASIGTIASTNAIWDNATQYSIGQEYDAATPTDEFIGNIDELALYDRELTQAEITRMFNTYFSPNRVANGNFSQIGNEEVTNGDFSQIGSEEVTNGDFATDSDWSDVNSVSTITNGQLVFNNSTLGGKFQSTSMVVGKIYKLVYTIVSISNGYIQPRLGDTGLSTQRTSAGTYTEYITCAGDTILRVYGSTTDGIVDNVSVKEVGQDWTFGTGWGMGDGIASCDGSQTGNSSLSQSSALPNASGKTYKITFTISNYVSGGVEVYPTNTTVGTYPKKTANGTYTRYVAVTSATPNDILYIQADSSFVGSVDNISVKEVGQHWTFGTGWSTDGTKAIATASSNANLVTAASILNGNTYKFTYTVSDYSGSGTVKPMLGTVGAVSGTTVNADGTYTENLVANANQSTIAFRTGGTAFTGSIDNIVVQELKHDATNLMLNAGAYQSANPLITSTKSMEFDGNDDYLELGSQSGVLRLADSNGSVSAWLYPTLGGDSFQRIVDKSDGGSGQNGYALILNNDGQVQGFIGSNILNSTTNLVAAKWQHILWSWDGTNHKIYINGVLNSTNSNSSKPSTNTNNMRFGSWNHSTAREYLGKMTEVGIYNRCLTALEVASLYNQGMPTNLLVNRNNYQSGNPTVFNTKQVDFDGTDTRLETNNELSGGTYSVTAWVKRDTIPSAWQYIVDFRRGNTSSQYVAYKTSGGIGVGSGSEIIYLDGVTSSTAPNDTEWHHIVVSGLTVGNSSKLTIGSRYTGLEAIDGDISQVGLWTGTLTADEVSSLYNHGLPIDLTTNQAAYESSSNLVGYWRMGSGTLDTYPLIADQTNATLGDELITCGDFSCSTPADYWTLQTGWSIATVDGNTLLKAELTDWNNAQYFNNSIVEANQVYKLEFDAVVNSGTCNIYFGQGFASTGLSAFSQTGHYELYMMDDQAGYLWFRSNNFNGTIDNISLKKVNGNPAIMTNQTSSDIENGSPYANIVQNGTFDTDSDWSKGTGVTISGGKANWTNTANNVGVNQNGIITSGKTYKISYTVSNYSSGSIRVRYPFISDTITANGTYTATAEATSTDLYMQGETSGDANVNLSIDNVTVEEVNTGLQGYWKMGDGTNDEYPVIYDQTNPTLSDEKVINGDFATDSDWSKGTGWSIVNGQAVHTGSASYLSQDVLQVDTLYKVYISIAEVDNSNYLQIYMGNSPASVLIQSIGDYTYYFTSQSSTTLGLALRGTGDVKINNISVKQVNGNAAQMTNMVEGNITNQYPLTKIRNYYRMGDGILDGYPIIQDQTSPNLAHIPTTNLFIYSEDFSQSNWYLDGVTLTSGQTSPIGDSSAFKLQFAGTNDYIQYAISGLDTTKDYTISFYAKVDSGTTTIDAGNIIAGSYEILTVTDEWQRFQVTQTPSATTRYPRPIQSNSADTIYLWGCQFEQQSQATAYLKSDGIAAVRKSSTTNLFEYSESFNNTSWSKSSVIVVDNSSQSPDDTNNASLMYPSSNGDYRYIHNSTITSSSSIHTISAFVKASGKNVAWFYINSGSANGYVYFDLSTQTIDVVVGSSGTPTGTITPYDNGWYKITFTSGTAFALNSGSGVGVSDAIGNPAVTVNGEDGILVWGLQLEQQTQAETYAKTTGLPVTIDLFTENNYGTMTNMSASDIVEDTPNN